MEVSSKIKSREEKGNEQRDRTGDKESMVSQENRGKKEWTGILLEIVGERMKRVLIERENRGNER